MDAFARVRTPDPRAPQGWKPMHSRAARLRLKADLRRDSYDAEMDARFGYTDDDGPVFDGVADDRIRAACGCMDCLAGVTE